MAQQHCRRHVGHESAVGGAGYGRLQADFRIADEVHFRRLELLSGVVLYQAVTKLSLS